MRYYLFLLALLFGCTSDPVDDDDILPDDDTTTDDDSSVSDDDSITPDDDATTDDDTADDDDTSPPDECAEADVVCGQTITTVHRSTWGASLVTQNQSVYDWTDPEDVAAGIVDGYYPPMPDWPSVSVFPQAYNDATWYLNNWYSWGWCCSVLDWPPEEHWPTAVTVHHTAGNTSDCDTYIAWVANYHIFGEGHGWGDIGYQMMVCEDAAGLHIYEGRMCTSNDDFSSMWCIGAHASGYNDGYVGISLVGDFTSVSPTVSELDTLTAVVARVMFEADIDSSDLYGHRDFGSTECPGDELYALLPDMEATIDWCQSCGY